MSATIVDYTKMFGNIIEVSDIIPTARCACVSCNSCTCACRGGIEYGDIAWQHCHVLLILLIWAMQLQCIIHCA